MFARHQLSTSDGKVLISQVWRRTLTTVRQYYEMLIESVEKLTSHSYISLTQTSYLQRRKDNLDNNSTIVLLDFAVNYYFVVQDEVLAFHWNNVQATLHRISYTVEIRFFDIGFFVYRLLFCRLGCEIN